MKTKEEKKLSEVQKTLQKFQTSTLTHSKQKLGHRQSLHSRKSSA